MGEYCPGARRQCYPPEKCCLSMSTCCIPIPLEGSPNDVSNRGSFPNHGLRFSLIDVWYFWFGVVFIITACTGVCAYYRRQRQALLLLARHSSIDRLHDMLNESQLRHSMAVSESENDHRRWRSAHNAHNFAIAMSGNPDSDNFLSPSRSSRESLDPPPYSEVANKPLGDESEVGLPSYAEVSGFLQQTCYQETFDNLNIRPTANCVPVMLPSAELPLYTVDSSLGAAADAAAADAGSSEASTQELSSCHSQCNARPE